MQSVLHMQLEAPWLPWLQFRADIAAAKAELLPKHCQPYYRILRTPD
jgi:hypothetical protein